MYMYTAVQVILLREMLFRRFDAEKDQLISAIAKRNTKVFRTYKVSL